MGACLAKPSSATDGFHEIVKPTDAQSANAAKAPAASRTSADQPGWQPLTPLKTSVPHSIPRNFMSSMDMDDFSGDLHGMGMYTGSLLKDNEDASARGVCNFFGGGGGRNSTGQTRTPRGHSGTGNSGGSSGGSGGILRSGGGVATSGRRKKRLVQGFSGGESSAENSSAQVDVCMVPSDPASGLPHSVVALGPPLPPCDAERLETLKALATVSPVVSRDAAEAEDPDVTSILKLVASIFQSPGVLLALFDDTNRIFVKDSDGFIGKGDFPWRQSFCAWTLLSAHAQTMIVSDASRDNRFKHNVMVTGPNNVRFYCGAPLVGSNGHRLGTLCFVDKKPRAFDASSARILNNLSELAVRHIEKDIAVHLQKQDNSKLAKAYQHLMRATDGLSQCILLVDVSETGWKVLYVSGACRKVAGVEPSDMVDATLSELFDMTGTSLPSAQHQASAAAGGSFLVHSVELSARLISAAQRARRETPALQAAQAASTGANTTSGEDEHRTCNGSGGLSAALPSSCAGLGTQGVLGTEVESSTGAHAHEPGTTWSQAQMQRRSLSGASDSACSLQGAKFVLEFRPATGNCFDDDNLVAIGVPSFTPRSALPGRGSVPHAERLFFATLLPSSAWSSSQGSTRASSTSQIIGRSICGKPHIDGLETAHLLGKGAFGSVYCGTWFGTPVAVKMINEDLSKLQVTSQGAISLEVMLGRELRHPHVVATLTYSCMKHSPASPPSAKDGTTLPPGHKRTSHSARSSTDSISKTPGHVTSGSVPLPPQQRQQPEAIAAPGAEGTPSTAASAEETGMSEDASSTTSVVLGAATGVSGVLPVIFSGEVAVCTDEDASSRLLGYGPGVEYLRSGGSSSCRDSAMSGGFSDAGGTPMLSAGTPVSGPPKCSTPTVDQAETWIVLEYCDRGSLQDATDRGWLHSSKASSSGPTDQVNMEAVLATGYEIAGAVSFLHTRGVVHGDLSAWNVLLSSSGPSANIGKRGFVAKVSDFGLARNLDMQTVIQTRTYGTLTHMPPEALTQGIISKETDVYSLGVLMWQIYTGSRPFAGMSHGQIVAQVASGKARLKFPSKTPTAYADLAQQCMSADRLLRPSAEEVVHRLHLMQSGRRAHK